MPDESVQCENEHSDGLDIRRGERTGPPTAEEKIDFCLSRLEEEGFEDVTWNTQVTPSLSVEEMIGALVDAEVELDE